MGIGLENRECCRCHNLMFTRDGMDPSDYCDDCAQEIVSQVAEIANGPHVLNVDGECIPDCPACLMRQALNKCV